MIFSPPVAPTEGGAGKARRSTALAALTSAVKLRCSSASCGKGREALVAEGYYAFFYVVFFCVFFCVFLCFFLFLFLFLYNVFFSWFLGILCDYNDIIIG